MLGDLYGLVPMNGGIVGVGSLWLILLRQLPVCLTGSVGILPTREEGCVGEIEVIPDDVELRSGINENVCGSGGDCWYPFTPSTIDARSLGCRSASRARFPQSELDEVPGQICCCRGGSWQIGGMASRFVMGGAVWRKLDKGESCSGSISCFLPEC